MALSNSILTLEKRLDERNQPKVGYVLPGECGGEDEICSTSRNQLFLGYVFRCCCSDRLRLEYDSVTFKRNIVFPSEGIAA